MGKKKTEEAPPAPEPKETKETNKADEVPDTPVVKALKELDDKLCDIELEFEKESEALRRKYREEKQNALLAERAKILGDISNSKAEDHPFGTPACKNFWVQSLQNCDELSELIEEWDEPVLEYLIDVKRLEANEDPNSPDYKVEFLFKENPYFTNTSLTVEAITNYDEKTYRPWKEPECIELKATEINWKPGKNVTVEVIQKKTKGGGAKKAKQKAKAKEEPRDSIFRHLFRNLKAGDPLPPELAESLNASMGRDEDDEDDDEDDRQEMMVKMVMEQGHEILHEIAEQLTPFAVRYYTGEAGGDDGDGDDDEDSEEEDDDDDDDDDDSEDEPPTRGRGVAKKKPNKKAAAAPGGAAGEKQEECKQQ